MPPPVRLWFREAIAIGRRFADPNIEIEAWPRSPAALSHDRPRQRKDSRLLDESMAALCAGELTEIASVDSLFCGLFWACELVSDVVRADQWMRATAEVMASRNVVGAFCRAHYEGILDRGWALAEAESAAHRRCSTLRPRDACSDVLRRSSG